MHWKIESGISTKPEKFTGLQEELTWASLCNSDNLNNWFQTAFPKTQGEKENLLCKLAFIHSEGARLVRDSWNKAWSCFCCRNSWWLCSARIPQRKKCFSKTWSTACDIESHECGQIKTHSGKFGAAHTAITFLALKHKHWWNVHVNFSFCRPVSEGTKWTFLVLFSCWMLQGEIKGRTWYFLCKIIFMSFKFKWNFKYHGTTFKAVVNQEYRVSFKVS